MENMSRKQMCNMLCNMGHEMQDLEVCSDAELMQMCSGMNHDMMENEMMENSMSRKQMCTMLCSMGYEMSELEVCSDAELMQMCGGMNHDMMDTEMMENHSSVNYMFFANLRAIKRLVDEMLSADEHAVDQMLTNGHNWALDHIATSKDDVEEVHGFLMDRAKKPTTDHHHMVGEKLNIIKSFKDFR